MLCWAFFTCLDRGKEKGGLTAAEPTPRWGRSTLTLELVPLSSVTSHRAHFQSCLFQTTFNEKCCKMKTVRTLKDVSFLSAREGGFFCLSVCSHGIVKTLFSLPGGPAFQFTRAALCLHPSSVTSPSSVTHVVIASGATFAFSRRA